VLLAFIDVKENQPLVRVDLFLPKIDVHVEKPLVWK